MSDLDILNIDLLISEYERIIIIKTLLLDLDINYITFEKLKAIENEAYDLAVDVDLPYIKDADAYKTYCKWNENVYKKYESIRKEIYNGLKRLSGD